ncbi:MAG: Grx4 family monothiol glutaredoxin [Myxococcales bacterium]|nr:Grx4 family monothiol glutaredoxin [Myxococcales bacterium]
MADAKERIQQLIQGSPVVLFMKGNRTFPMCGFSAKVCELLDSAGAKYETVDVLSDPAIRQGIKEFSNWPTIPQLYVGGKFIGGCDIVTELAERGELKETVHVAA